MAEATTKDPEQGRFSVRFWGVRGSIATPDPRRARYGGNTSCIELDCGVRGAGLYRLVKIEQKRAAPQRQSQANGREPPSL